MRMTVVAFIVTRMMTGDAELPPAAEIANAELSFARQSVTEGMYTAFAAHFADHAVDFSPLPRRDARQYYADKPDPPIILDWYPTYTLAAASGDFGLSTGPYELRDTAGVQPIRYGHYVSMWAKQPDGQWKVAIDGGTNHAKSESPLPRLEPTVMADNRVAAAPGWRGTSPDVLLELDVTLSEAGNLPEALERYGDESVRFYRDGSVPIMGKFSVVQFAKSLPGNWRWQAQGAEVATSGDLGFTYGESRRSTGNSDERGAFLHVWKRTPSGWRLLLARESAVPAQP